MQPHFQLVSYALVLVVSFSVYGIIQEKIITRPYGIDPLTNIPLYFDNTTFLVLYNRVFATVVVLLIMLWRGEDIQPVAPFHRYAMISAFNSGASWCQYEALKYVSFPTQTLGKCSRILPVMAMGYLFQRRMYQWTDCFVALCVTFGCTLFVLNGNISTRTGNDSDTPFGLVLIGLYMALDGLTSTNQEHAFQGFSMSPYNQMAYVNLCSGLLCLSSLLLNGSFWSGFITLYNHPRLFVDSSVLSLTSTIGQLTLYHLIKDYGAVVFATVTVTRQIVSMTLSCIIFLHPLTLTQFASIGIVFSALYAKAMLSRSGKARLPTPAKDSPMIERSAS